MPGFLQSLLDDYLGSIERHRNRPFLNAAMATCALAACATGEVSFSERIRVDQILDTLERLKIFDPHEGVDLFNEYSDAILASSREGHRRAHSAIQPFVDEPETAGLLVRICLAVADSSGDQSLSQRIEAVMLCDLLGVDPVRVGLIEDGRLAGLEHP